MKDLAVAILGAAVLTGFVLYCLHILDWAFS
jgi:hypothetical protein